MIKLLNKPLKYFILYSIAVLLAGVPIYYVVVEYIWAEELDENNEIIANRAKYQLDRIDYERHNMDSLVAFWNTIQPNSRLVDRLPTQGLRDTLYSIYKSYPYSNHRDVDRFRVMETPVEVGGKSYTLIIESNLEESYEIVGAIILVTTFLVIILVGGLFFLNQWISRQIWTPFKKTLEKIKHFELSDEKLPEFETTRIIEFEELHDYLLRSMAKGIDVFKMQKEFIENVSHEIQTPLAIIQNKLNLVLQTEPISKEQFELVEKTNKALARAVKINKSLLFMAKLDNSQFTQTEKIEFGEEIRDIVELTRSEFDRKSLQLELDIADEIHLVANKELTMALMQNLITNILKYTLKSGFVYIGARQTGLSFHNSGSMALDKDKIFHRFMAMDKDNPGTGIGLALVKEICKQHNWRILYSFEGGIHRFDIVF